MKFSLSSGAMLDYSEAIEFYAEQSPELGQAFINAIENSIYRIREFPNRWGIMEGDVRRCQVKKFPYSILYQFKDDENEPSILIIAVMHGRREEGYWKTRIGLD
jgi:toxin ParE1/3/4